MKERDPKSPATVEDIENQNALIAEMMNTLVIKSVEENKKYFGGMFIDTQKRIVEFENETRNRIQDHEERLQILEQKDSAYIWVQKYGVKIFVTVCAFFSLLILIIKLFSKKIL